jgi:hypothetical protein
VRRTGVRVLEVSGAIVLALALGLLVFTLELQYRGRSAMERSDAAFHRGDLRESIREAQTALLAYVPSSDHVREAEQRLVAIGRGAETDQKFEVARAAWESLRVGYLRTHYPGKPDAEYLREAERALSRIDGELAKK